MKQKFLWLRLLFPFPPRLWSVCFAVIMGVGATLITIAGLQAQSQSFSSSSIITTNGRYLMRYGTRFEVRGMNYYPKDYAWEKFWANYETITVTTQISQELDLAKALGVNTVRVFAPYSLFSGTVVSAYPGYLEDFINQLETRDMVAIVTLFDLYVKDEPAAYSSTNYADSKRHISTVINSLGSTNPTVLAWDIKNEMDRDYAGYSPTQVKAWATEMINYTDSIDPNHLITIGFYGAVTTTTGGLVYSPTIAAEFTSAVDFVSLHYFLSEGQFEDDLQALRTQIGDNKPIVLEEFGLHTLATPIISCVISSTDPKCDDPHTETDQAAYYNALFSISEAYGVAGYLFWTLNDFSYIQTNTQESHHCQGILRNSNVNECQVSTATDYTEKPAAERVQRHYYNDVAYLDMFDSWVVTTTDMPPPGWSDNYNLVSGTAHFRGYNPLNPNWSQTPGKVAFTKVVTGGTSITGTALSPLLQDVNINHYPILAGQVYSYSVRDSVFGSHSRLHIGVQEEGMQTRRLLTITPAVSVPYTFSIDLREPPTNWNGIYDFRIVFELVPESPTNGYSAAYEFDWIAVESTPADLIVQKAISPGPFVVGQAVSYTLTIFNTGPQTATDIILTDTLPAAIAFGSVLSNEMDCNTTNVITCTLNSLSSGLTATATIVVTPIIGGDIINTAQVLGNEYDPFPMNNFTEQSAWVCCPNWLPIIFKNSS